MAQIHWLAAISGNFDTAADWSGGVVPGPADDVILDAAGPAYTVTRSSSGYDSVNSVQTAANATLVAQGLTVANGTGAGANAGVVVAHLLNVTGPMDNPGEIMVAGAGLLGVQGQVALSGGGEVVLQADDASVEGVGAAPASLTNVDNTISGSGQINIYALTNEAAGIIDANVPSGSFLFLSTTVLSNAGLIAATGGGALIVGNLDNAGTVLADGGRISLYGQNSNGGLIEAEGGGAIKLENLVTGSSGGSILADGGTIHLAGATLAGGILRSAGGGVMDVLPKHGAVLDGEMLAVTNQAVLTLVDGANLTLLGMISNIGEIALASLARATTLTINSASVGLSGGGKVTLGGPLAAIIGAAAGDELDNIDNLITGAGLIGEGQLTLANEAAGVIQATGAMTIDTGSSAVANAGKIKAVGAAAALTIASPVSGTGKLKVVGGSLTAQAAVSQGEAVIAGGQMHFASSFAGAVEFKGSGALYLAQSQSFGGPVSGFSTSGTTSLDLGDVGFVSAAEASFSGDASGGVLTVSDGVHTANITLVGDYTASTFIAAPDGSGGVVVTDPARLSSFASAMASHAPGAGPAGSAGHERWRPAPAMLAVHAALA